MSKIAVIGAGKTGRGFVGRLLAEAGRDFLLVDKDEELINALNARRVFSVHFFGNIRPAFEVKSFTACTWENADFSDTELIFVSVGGQNLKDVGEKLSGKLRADRKYHIITCENASKPSQILRNAIIGKQIAVSESTVFCTTIEAEGLDISSENYPYLQCNAELLEGYVPDIPSVRALENFSDFLTRKLYTYNAASCVIAYLGFVKGYTDYGEAANDPEILALLDRNYAATNQVLCKIFGYDEKDQAEFARLSRVKFTDRTITDTIARNAREPQRKLQVQERIIGPLRLLQEHGGDTEVLLLTAAAALHYRHESDQDWQKIVGSKTPEEILTEICGLQPGSSLFNGILEKFHGIKVKSNSIGYNFQL